MVLPGVPLPAPVTAERLLAGVGTNVAGEVTLALEHPEGAKIR